MLNGHHDCPGAHDHLRLHADRVEDHQTRRQGAHPEVHRRADDQHERSRQESIVTCSNRKLSSNFEHTFTADSGGEPAGIPITLTARPDPTLPDDENVIQIYDEAGGVMVRSIDLSTPFPPVIVRIGNGEEIEEIDLLPARGTLLRGDAPRWEKIP